MPPTFPQPPSAPQTHPRPLLLPPLLISHEPLPSSPYTALFPSCTPNGTLITYIDFSSHGRGRWYIYFYSQKPISCGKKPWPIAYAHINIGEVTRWPKIGLVKYQRDMSGKGEWGWCVLVVWEVEKGVNRKRKEACGDGGGAKRMRMESPEGYKTERWDGERKKMCSTVEVIDLTKDDDEEETESLKADLRVKLSGNQVPQLPLEEAKDCSRDPPINYSDKKNSGIAINDFIREIRELEKFEEELSADPAIQQLLQEMQQMSYYNDPQVHAQQSLGPENSSLDTHLLCSSSLSCPGPKAKHEQNYNTDVTEIQMAVETPLLSFEEYLERLLTLELERMKKAEELRFMAFSSSSQFYQLNASPVAPTPSKRKRRTK